MISKYTIVKQYEKKLHVEYFNKNLNDSLLTLYAQAWGITLAPPVLPRRLARVFAGAHDKSAPHNNDLSHLFVYDKNQLHNIAGSSVSSLPKIPHCSLQSELGPCLSPNVAEQPLSPAKHNRLGAL